MLTIRYPLRWGLILLALTMTAVAVHNLPRWFPQLARSAWGRLGMPLAKDVPQGLADLPVIMVDGHDPHGPLAVLLSGNGGWWGIDDRLARTFAAKGITTIGLNSLAYFLSRRTPEETAATIGRMVGAFDPGRPLLLVGYSFGADVAATTFAHLDPQIRQRVRMVSLLGLSPQADYAEGLWKIAAAEEPTVPAVRAITGPHVQCFQGADEGADSACGALDPSKVEVLTLPGGHHFNGDYAAVARDVVAGLSRLAQAAR